MAEEATQTDVFVDNGDGTITDSKNGLMWQKGDVGPMNWKQAVEACENLQLGGHSDWRLPDQNELKGLFKALSDDEHVWDRRFPPFEWSSDRYWTSRLYPPYNAAFLVNFRGGSIPWEPRYSEFYVRAVRKPTADATE